MEDAILVLAIFLVKWWEFIVYLLNQYNLIVCYPSLSPYCDRLIEGVNQKCLKYQGQNWMLKNLVLINVDNSFIWLFLFIVMHFSNVFKIKYS